MVNSVAVRRIIELSIDAVCAELYQFLVNECKIMRVSKQIFWDSFCIEIMAWLISLGHMQG